MANKYFKCYDCENMKFTDVEDLYDHIEEEHRDNIPLDMTVKQYYYMKRTGKYRGSCVMCKKDTRWNDETGKYSRFCDNPRCKQKYRDEFKKRMIAKHGKVHLLNDPQKQREMLANRRISGQYKWSDGTTKLYTGSYEKNALEFEDLALNMHSNDIETPSPHNYVYEYNGNKHFYFPDQFIYSLNAEIEIKDGGDNPNNHPKIQLVDKEKERLKDEVMKSQSSFNYLKLTNNNFNLLLKFIAEIKAVALSDNPNRKVIMIDDEITYNRSNTPVYESAYEDDYQITEIDMLVLESIINSHKDNEEALKLDNDVLDDKLKEMIRND